MHSKPKTDRRRIYACRLCKKQGITTRKAHLQNFHNTDKYIRSKRNNDLIDIIFVKNR